jgi:hypothetical protein
MSKTLQPDQASSKMKSAARSASAYTVAERCPLSWVGNADASTTRTFVVPYTRSLGSTTPPSSRAIIAALPSWWLLGPTAQCVRVAGTKRRAQHTCASQIRHPLHVGRILRDRLGIRSSRLLHELCNRLRRPELPGQAYHSQQHLAVKVDGQEPWVDRRVLNWVRRRARSRARTAGAARAQSRGSSRTRP